MPASVEAGPFALAALLALGSAAPPQEPAPSDPRASLVEHTLDNGWTFLLLPRPSAPVVSIDTYVRVGSVDERPGATGMAHVFEHMAFKGSDRLGTLDWEAERAVLEEVDAHYLTWRTASEAGEAETAAQALAAFREAEERAAAFAVPEAFGRWLEDAGGAETLNASTRADGTHFHVSLPANQLELWCWLEAERFSRPVMREFYLEREAILEERRSYNESDPFGLLAEVLFLEAFRTHPYRNPVIGFAADIARHSRPEAERFFREQYGARRMITAVVGDFDPETLIPELERYLSTVPAGAERPPLDAVEPPQLEERRVSVTFPAQPILACGWRVPSATHPDHFAIQVAVRVLGSGRSSRLVRRLVREDAVASEVYLEAGLPGDRHPNLVVFFGLPTSSRDCAALETALNEEIERLAEEGPQPDELAGVLRRDRVATWRMLRSNEATAAALVECQARYGDWRLAFDRPEKLTQVDAGDVQRVVRTYLIPARRTVATLVPAAATSPDAEGTAPDGPDAGGEPTEPPATGGGPTEPPAAGGEGG